MHQVAIESLRDEAQRLLRLNIEGLGQMMAAKGVITEAKEGLKQTFDRTSTPKYIEVLQGELTKLNNMELVIAVVGTMKAGKSTTINAIVGTEVLPNRNRPMTALPTLIRHTPGQIEPILKFENNEPITTLFESIRKQMVDGTKRITRKSKGKGNTCTVDEVIGSLLNDSDMRELIGLITKKVRLHKDYQGAENIFWCLKTLNDLVRLSNELDVPFPFSSYSNVEQMPVIAVEFAHLREAGETNGQLTLLDTPGPNEAGQDHLRDMLTEQLKKTSAVLAVFDYTQLKSDADEQVRNEIESIAQLHKGRLFALVNKFDQKDRNGDGKEAAQALVADKLMDGLLDRKHVFPVSSKWGYLANRARHEVAVHHRLPNSEESSWVVDFAEEAFGRRWESKISDNEEVIKSANALWEDSGFHEPMENVIRAAHTKTALLSIDSAAEKLVQCAADIENFLGVRLGALSQSADALKKRIEDLKTDIFKVEKMEQKTYETIASNFTILKSHTTYSIDQAKKNSLQAVKDYFKEGKRAEKKAHELAQKQESKHSTQGLIDEFFQFGKQNKVERDFNPDEKTLKFRSEDDALQQINLMQSAIDKSIEGDKSNLNESVNSMLEEFRITFDKDAEEAKCIISGINSDMVNDGFKINLKLPNTTKLNKTLEDSNLALKNKIEHQTKSETYRVEQNSWWGGFKRFLNSSWGYEERTRQVNEYIINIEEIKKFVVKSIDNDFSVYIKTMEKEVTEPISFEVDNFFKVLKEALENIRGDLQQGLADKQGEVTELDDLKMSLVRFQMGIPAIKEDAEALSYDINHLKNVTVVA